ncbi:MAG: GspH/FimT family pseudopilin [Gammaproteobacteria bacterium]|nr:GspH/FimT family pseudopilin [Gammaproteobacteria bacterium]
MCPYQKGFTLIELVIVMSLVAVISAFSISTLHRGIEHEKQYARLYELGQTILFARNYAISHNTSVTLCPSENQHSCQESWDSGAILLAAHTTIISLPALPKGHRLTLEAYPKSNAIQFTHTGILSVSNGKFIYILPDGSVRDLFISKTGRIRFSQGGK